MRAQHLQQTRPQWYDRNPTIFGAQAGYINRAPFGVIVLSTYTVPANRKALVEAAQASTWRDTAAAPVGLWQLQVQVTQPAEGTGILPICITNNNTVQFRIDIFAAVQCVLKAAGQVIVVSDDQSVGGTTSGWFGYKGTEYDN